MFLSYRLCAHGIREVESRMFLLWNVSKHLWPLEPAKISIYCYLVCDASQIKYSRFDREYFSRWTYIVMYKSKKARCLLYVFPCSNPANTSITYDIPAMSHCDITFVTSLQYIRWDVNIAMARSSLWNTHWTSLLWCPVNENSVIPQITTRW